MTTYRIVMAALALVVMGCSSQSKKVNLEDPYLWLEEVESVRSLSWVKEQNEKSEAQLTNHPSYLALEKDFRRILLAKDRLPFVSYSHGYVYNFWQDDKNVRGIWRRATLESYKQAIVDWQTVLDIDELAKGENENWVWKGVTCLAPEQKQCLVFLSRGGKDAIVVREFNLPKREFVKNGFLIPEAKTNISWIDKDSIFVASDFGPGTMTKSGYPRQVKVWKRGTPLTSAKLVLEVSTDDLSVSGGVYDEPGKKWAVVSREIDFYRHTTSLYKDEKLTELPIPDDSSIRGVFAGKLLFSLKSPYTRGDQKFEPGSLLALNLNDFTQPLELIFEPKDKAYLSSVDYTRNSVLLGVMENVQERLYKAVIDEGKWDVSKLAGHNREAFSSGSLRVHSADPLEEVFIARHEDFLSPPSVVIGEDSGRGIFLMKVKSSPDRFNSSGLVSEQFETLSRDGAKIPYFVIRPAAAKLNGKNPTVLYGYGGFQISMTPYYLNATGKVWLERHNGIYVVANIRGGGEFGPVWHEAARQTRRQKAFDDFTAVAEDLIKRKITSPEKLGIMGGSNGGLLVGATMVQRPELFKAVVCQVPLLDMLRYHTLLAGHSWVAEYGDPEDPKMREAILEYSPYQNLDPRETYPMTLFVTSTKDDRVHPGHARKMMARMSEYGKPALYWENTEGGHAGAANLEQRIKASALQWTFLVDQLVKPGVSPQK